MKTLVIDDDSTQRNLYSQILQALSFESISLANIEKNVISQIKRIDTDSFVLCDYKLTAHEYATINGDNLISTAYKACIPGILSSSNPNFRDSLSRSIRRYLPIMMTFEELSEKLIDSNFIYESKKEILEEFNGNFTEKRKPWRALVRSVDYNQESKNVKVVVPGWNASKEILIPLSDFPKNLKKLVTKNSMRFFANINLDCEIDDNLYISNIEDYQK